MLVLWEQRLTLLATPKTGSTALAAALESQAALAVTRPPVLKHTTVHRYQRFIAPYLRAASGHDFETLALIREPLDWLGSWYRYRQRGGVEPEKSTAAIDFDSFVREYMQPAPRPFADIGSQARFLRGKTGGVDHLFRHDRMDLVLDFLQARLGKRPDLSRHNVSPEGDLTLSAGTADLLRETCAEDFALYESCS